MKQINVLLFLLLLNACSTSTSITRIHYQDHEKQVGYTQVIQIDNRVLISGVVAPGPEMDKAIKSVYASIQYILQKHGASMRDVVKEILFTTDIAAMQSNEEVRKQFYPEGYYPVATWVEVSALYLPEYILEVSVEAVLSKP
ncbi:MAG: RidA family protein [Marinicella sp.]